MRRLSFIFFICLHGYKAEASPLQSWTDSAAWKKFRSDSAFIADSIHLPEAVKLLAFHWSSLPLEFVQRQVARIPDSLLVSKPGQKIVEELKDEALLEVGDRFPDFPVIMPNGDSTSFYHILPKATIVLVDFWASWCPPCRSNSPDIKALSHRFASDRLGIISLSMDTDAAKWRQAIIEDDLSGWAHVREASKGAVSRITGIGFIPRYVLLDQERRVLGKFNGRWKGLYDLEELIKDQLMAK